MTSDELRETGEALEGIADALDDAASRHRGAHDNLEAKIEELTEAWTSPDRSAVTLYGRTLARAVRPIHSEGGLPDASTAINELAGTAADLAGELATEEAALETARDNQLQGLRDLYNAPPDDPDSRNDAERRRADATRDINAAESRIAEIETRWWGACETCSGAINTAVYRVSTPQEVGIGGGGPPVNGQYNTGIFDNTSEISQELRAYQDSEGNRIDIDGSEATVTGSDESDFVEIVERDGQLVVVISQLNTDGELVEVASHALPDDVDTLTVRTGSGNDVVSVPPGVAENINLNFNVGDGNNVVGYANPDSSIMSISGGDGINVVTGDGDNTIHGSQGDDRIVTGEGDQNISGVSGSNIISAMGDGRNQIQGGDQDDIIRTGDGDDYIDGGKGGDFIESTGGDNILSAGEGDGDHLVGGTGDDTFIFGRGETHVDSVGGHDTVYLDRSNNGHTYDRSWENGGSIRNVNIEVEGRPGEDAVRLERPDGISDAEWEAWVHSVESDMEMLRHTPSGQAGLDALDEDVGKSGWFWNRQPAITVSPVVNKDDDFNPQPFDVAGYMANGRTGQDSFASSNDGVGYDTDGRMGQDGNADSRTPSSIILFHEFAHMRDYETGNIDGMNDELYEEVILDADGNEVASQPLRSSQNPDNYFTPEINSVGYDQDGSGTIEQDEVWGDHPPELTEFEIRQDLGLDPRTGYLTDPSRVPEGGRVIYRRIDED